jgi:hypothetical protein
MRYEAAHSWITKYLNALYWNDHRLFSHPP